MLSKCTSNTSYCYCKINGFKSIAVAPYTVRTVLLAPMRPLSPCAMPSVCLYNVECRLS